MKIIVLISLISLYALQSLGQAGNDSVAYQLQRTKINAMLIVRTQKFGQYDQSLSRHTGIFGLQTKKDIRRSNDILMDIVRTDDAIYKELKILFEYSNFQQTQVQSHFRETEDNNLGFMITINKLRLQNDQLKAEAEKQRQKHDKTRHLYIIVLILIIASIFFLFTWKNKGKL